MRQDEKMRQWWFCKECMCWCTGLAHIGNDGFVSAISSCTHCEAVHQHNFNPRDVQTSRDTKKDTAE